MKALCEFWQWRPLFDDDLTGKVLIFRITNTKLGED